MDFIESGDEVCVARRKENDVDIRPRGLTDARERAQHVNALLFWTPDRNFLSAHIENRSTISAVLIPVLEVPKLDHRAVNPPLRCLGQTSPMLLPVMINMVEPTEHDRPGQGCVRVTRALPSISLTNRDLSELNGMNERLVPLTSRVEDIPCSEVDVLIVDDDRGSEHGISFGTKKSPPIRRRRGAVGQPYVAGA
jgi:hypothetical protein